MSDIANRRAAIKTLGCKLNQYESEQIREQLRRRGYDIVPFESVAELYVINSCTVTSRTDRDCRRLVRHARGLNPEAMVVVTGCYAEVGGGRLREMEAVDLVVGNARKHEIAELVSAGGESCGESHASGADDLIDEFAGHTRAFVKVQEGCDADCAYCIIPRARGCSRSVPSAEVIAQAQRLAAGGHPELVLIGTHLGRYGQDLNEGPELADLCERLCDLDYLRRLRLSSIEPLEVGKRLVELVAAGGHALSPDPALPGQGKFCRYLHVPLQSGCDSVLKRMNRPYDTAYYADLVRRVKWSEPGVCIGADVMVGFPGETGEEFEETCRFIASIPMSYLHVFTYSPREGTVAAAMPGQVQGQVKKERAHVLAELSVQLREAFIATQVSRTLEVVVERFAQEASGLLRGVSDNYVQVVFPGDESLMGRIVAVRGLRAEGERLVGELAE